MELCWITAAGVRTPTPDEARESAARDDGVLWAHCDHKDIAGMALLTELVPVRPPDLTVCHVRSPVPLLRAYPDHFFSAMNGLARGSDRRLHFLPVRIFTRPPIVFTVFGPHHATLSAATTQEDLVWRVGSDFTVRLRDTGACRLLRLMFCALVMSRN